jgi:hypothetical protein
MGGFDPPLATNCAAGAKARPHVVSPRRQDRSTHTPRWRKDDVTRQVSWLAALARSVRLPKTHLHASQWHFGPCARRLQLRGQPRNKAKQHPHRVPFFQPPSRRLRQLDTEYGDSTTLESKARQVVRVVNRAAVTFRLQAARRLPRSMDQDRATAVKGSSSTRFAL